MMRSNQKITRDTAYAIIKKFAKQYRKELGKAPGEIIFVGGGSIMLNYKFRDTTQDFDVILNTVSGIKDVISKFADENDLPRDWMNNDFMKTSSYSNQLLEVSRHYTTLNNGTLEIRTVSGVYLIAMKLRARRNYRNDISDAIGILLEEKENGNNITYEDIKISYYKLYEENISNEIEILMQNVCNMNLTELKDFYHNQLNSEQSISSRVISYIDNGANINAKNVEEVIARIKEKMNNRENE